MAQRMIAVTLDDLDGSAASETVSFGLDGVLYEIDLSDPNAAQLRNLLTPYQKAGRRAGGRRRPPVLHASPEQAFGAIGSNGTDPSSRSARRGAKKVSARAAAPVKKKSAQKKAAKKKVPSAKRSERLKSIREWAHANGVEVADKGRLPAAVEAAYDEAMAANS